MASAPFLYMMDFFNRNLRILNITHCDLDGGVAGIVVKRFYEDCTTYPMSYGKFRGEQAVKYINENRMKFDAVVFTDFSPIDFLDAFNELNIPYLILDHHESALPLSNPAEGKYIITKCCGAMLAYKYYVRKAPELECLKELVELANDYDMWLHKDVRSRLLNTIYWCYYGFEAFYNRFKKGFNGFNDWEKGELRKAHNQFKKLWDDLPLTDLPHNGCLCTTSTLMSEISLQLEKEGYKWFIIYNDFTHRFHLRSRLDNVDFAKICANDLKRGGGHSKAAACECNPDEVESLTKAVVAAVEKCF